MKLITRHSMAWLMPQGDIDCAQCRETRSALAKIPLPVRARRMLVRDAMGVTAGLVVVLGLVAEGFRNAGFVPLASAACLAVVLLVWRYGAGIRSRMASCRYVVFSGVAVAHPYDSKYGVHWHVPALGSEDRRDAVQYIGGVLFSRVCEVQSSEKRLRFISDWSGSCMTLEADNRGGYSRFHFPDVRVTGDPDLVVGCAAGEMRPLVEVFLPRYARPHLVEQ